MNYVNEAISGFLFGGGFLLVAAVAKYIFHFGLCG